MVVGTSESFCSRFILRKFTILHSGFFVFERLILQDSSVLFNFLGFACFYFVLPQSNRGANPAARRQRSGWGRRGSPLTSGQMRRVMTSVSLGFDELSAMLNVSLLLFLIKSNCCVWQWKLCKNNCCIAKVFGRNKWRAPFEVLNFCLAKVILCPLVECGVTWEPLTYCPWAIFQTNRSKFLLDAGPKLKWVMTALSTRGWVLASPWVVASISSLHTMFCLRKDNKSVSSAVITCPGPMLVAMTERERENLKGSCDHPRGEGMLGNYQQNSRIVILCIYSLSNIYN